MRITILLLIVGICIVSAKYLPYEDESSVLLRNRRSNSEESNTSVESDNDSNDNEDDDDSGEQQIDKQRRKKEEEQRKLEEKKAKELRKQEEKRQKEERKHLERIEKEKRKEEEIKRKLLEKHEKEEKKKQEKQLKELEKLRKEALEEESDEDGFLETEEENSVELGNIWRNHIYVKYGLTLASTHAEKKAVLDRYLSEELGLNSNSTHSERQRAIVKLIETKLQNDTESKEALRKQLLSQINSLTINKLQNKLNKGIEKLTNKTQILNNVTLPWVSVAQQNLEERKTFLQSISQLLSNVLPNWSTGAQNQNTSVQQNVQGNDNAIYISEGKTVANSGITVNADKNVDSNAAVASGDTGVENDPNITSIDTNNNAVSDTSLVTSISNDSADSPAASNVAEGQSSLGASNIPAIEIGVGINVDSNAAGPSGVIGIENDFNIASLDTNNNVASDANSVTSISNDSVNSPAVSNVSEGQSSSGASNIPAIDIRVGTSVDSNTAVSSGVTGVDNDSNLASIDTNNNAASDAGSITSISNDTANSPAASNVADVQSPSGATNILAVKINVGTSVDSNAAVPSGDTGEENNSNIATLDINNNAASDASAVPSISNDIGNLPATSNVAVVQSSLGVSNIPNVEIDVGTSESNVVIISNQSDPNSSVIPGSIDTPVLESQSSGVSDVSLTISSSGDSVANNTNNEVNRPMSDSSDIISSASSDSNISISGKNITKNVSSNNVDAGSPSNSILVSESGVVANGVQSSNINESNNSVVNNQFDSLSGVSSPDTKVNNEVTVPSRPNLTANGDLVPSGVNVEQPNVLSGISDSSTNITSNSNGVNNEIPSDGNVDVSNVGSSIVVVSLKDKSESPDPVIGSTDNNVHESINGDNANSLTSNSVANLPVNSDPIITTSVDSTFVLSKDIGVESNSNIASIDINNNVASDTSAIPSMGNDTENSPAAINVSEIQSSSGASDIPDVEINVATSDSNNVVLTNSNVGSTVNVDDFITTDAPINNGVSISLENKRNAVLSESLDQNDKEISPSTNAKTLSPISTNESKVFVTISNIASSDVTESSLSSGVSDNTVVESDGNVVSSNKVEISSSAPTSNINSGIGNTVNIIDIITTGAPIRNGVSVLPEQNITDINNNNISVSSTPSVATDSGLTTSQPDTFTGINVVQNITYSSSDSGMSGISNINESSSSVINNVTVATESIILSTVQEANDQNTSVAVEVSTQANKNESPTVDQGVATTEGEAIINVNTASSDPIAETPLSSTGSIQIDGITVPAEQGASVVEILPQL